MKNYQKPTIVGSEELSEGIYMASGSAQCNSQYMSGVFRKPDYSINNHIDGLGCNGCPAFRGDHCGLQTEEYWGSYDVDNGNRKPGWEREGKDPQAVRW